MNERIKQLAEQCRKEVEHFSSDTGFTYTEELDEEKFAELIIRECVKICYETTGNSYLNGVAAGTKIILHFGVKNEQTN